MLSDRFDGLRKHRHPRTRVAPLLLGLWLLGAAPAVLAEISTGGPLRVRILYDNSGSMYPGYAPPGRPGTPRSVSGARFFHQYPEFQQWLADFVASQTVLNGSAVSMWTLTSGGAFSPGDVRRVHPEVAIGDFDAAQAVRSFPDYAGQNTYLTESLAQGTRGFEGLVWLITDNIVETRAGEPNADVRRFFETLKTDPRYRSVHLFKYPFADDRAGQRSALAIYGVLVSGSPVEDSVLAHYDRKLRSGFRFANRRQGDPPGPLFPGREHLKLKDLRIDPLELQAVPNLQVTLDDPAKNLFKEGQRVQLELAGAIQSYLTQHSVTGGRYRLEFAGPFEPESWAREQLKAQALPASLFQSVDGEIQEPIGPNQTRDVRASLRSLQPVSLKSPGAGAWLRLALNGAAVKYTGRVRMSFDDITVRLERDQMAGIFGIDEASSVFTFQDVTSLPNIAPSEATVDFTIKTGNSRTAVFLLALLVLAVLLGAAGALLLRKRWYHVRISGNPERLIPLRRLGSHTVLHEGQPLGRLTRTLAGEHDFVPTPPSAALTVSPTAQPDVYDVRFRDGRGCQLAIEPQGGAKKKALRQDRPAAGPPPPPSPLGSGLPSGRPLPKIDRP